MTKTPEYGPDGSGQPEESKPQGLKKYPSSAGAYVGMFRIVPSPERIKEIVRSDNISHREARFLLAEWYRTNRFRASNSASIHRPRHTHIKRKNP